MGDLKVKGTMLVDQVRMIRANKGLDWSKYLSPADCEIINTRIFSSMWYPLEIYQKCGQAIFQVVAKGNLELVHRRGRMRGKELFEGVYQSLIISNDPMGSLNRFVIVYGQFFNFSNLRFKDVGRNHALLYLDSKSTQNENMPYSSYLMGHLEVLIEMAEGKNARIVLTAKQWEGAPETVFDVTWE